MVRTLLLLTVLHVMKILPASGQAPALLSREYLCGKFDPAKHPDFARIPLPYAEREGMYLRKDALDAFIQMAEKAAGDSIRLFITSATRNFARQKEIWENKWRGKKQVDGQALPVSHPSHTDRARKILEYSSMPGTSRHHWGTDIDINSDEPEYFDTAEGKKVYAWLTRHAPAYGFGQPYTAYDEDRPFGYQEEKWHWSWLPVAKPLTAFAAENLRDRDLNGFAGCRTAPAIGIVEHYVLGVHPSCLPGEKK